MANKPRMISVRLTEEQYQAIQETIKFIELETGTRVTMSSLVLKLLAFGKPILEQLYPRPQKHQSVPINESNSPKKALFGIFR